MQTASAEDLLALVVWADAVRRDRGSPLILIPYLPGARQDRRRPGEALSAAVYADLINACGADRVLCFDPHSDVMPALVRNCEVVSPGKVVSRLIGGKHEVEGIVIPDAGAAKRATDVARLLALPTYQAVKQRDSTTGDILGFSCENLPPKGRLLVVDDICDRGPTFLRLAESLAVPSERLRLWVSHGIFSGSLADLFRWYGAIYTTDSHQGSERLRQEQRKQDLVVPLFPVLLSALQQSL